MSTKLGHSFYLNDNVVKIAKSLLGKVLVTSMEGVVTSGMIVETEAYSWKEQGCHAFNHKRTKRNEPMYYGGGISYVYLCYGVYELFNVVTNQEGIPEAVLIRALEPIDGIASMLERRKTTHATRITSGPGKLTRALGISRQHNGTDIAGDSIWIEDRNIVVKPSQIVRSSRIGLNVKGEDALLPWRFTIKSNVWVSK